MKKALLCVTALCLSVLLCSCWDYTELNLRHIATGLALDQGKEQTYLMTVELMTFEGEKASSRLLQAEADTLDACVAGIVRQLGRHPYWNHAKIMLIGEDLFEQDIIPMLDWFVHTNGFSLGLLIAQVEQAQARAVCVSTAGAVPQATSLNLMLDDQVSFGEIPSCPLYSLYNAMLTKDAVISVPRLTLTGEDSHVTFSGMLTLEGSERRLEP